MVMFSKVRLYISMFFMLVAAGIVVWICVAIGQTQTSFEDIEKHVDTYSQEVVQKGNRASDEGRIQALENLKILKEYKYQKTPAPTFLVSKEVRVENARILSKLDDLITFESAFVLSEYDRVINENYPAKAGATKEDLKKSIETLEALSNTILSDRDDYADVWNDIDGQSTVAFSAVLFNHIAELQAQYDSMP